MHPNRRLATSTPGHVHGTYGFYFHALDGVLFEVACRDPGA